MKEDLSKKVTKEFIDLGSGEMHGKIVDTLIKEIYLDTGNQEAWNVDRARIGYDFGTLSQVLMSGQSLYANERKLTYTII